MSGWHEDEACDKEAFTRRMVREAQNEKLRMANMIDARPGGLDGGKIAKQSPIDAAHLRAIERAENLHKLIHALRERLGAVLAPRLEQTSAGPQPQAPRAIGGSAIVAMFESLADINGATAEALGDILSRLEL